MDAMRPNPDARPGENDEAPGGRATPVPRPDDSRPDTPRARVRRPLTGIRLIRARLTSRTLALLALATAVLVSLITLTTLVAFTSQAQTSAVRATYFGHPTADRALVLQGNWSGSAPDVTALQRAGGERTTISQRGWGLAYGLPGTSGDDAELLRMAWIDGIESQATLTEGRWPNPSPGTQRIELAIPRSVATTLEWRVGQDLDLADRVDDAATLPVTVVGIYDLNDRDAAFWIDSKLARTGRDDSGFISYGPAIIHRDTFTQRLTRLASASIVVVPDVAAMDSGNLPEIRAQIDEVLRVVRSDPTLSSLEARTELPQVLADAANSEQLTRRALIVPQALLALVAAVALWLAARLLSALRSDEHRLMASRGGTRWSVWRMLAGEALLIVIPAALLAALVSGPLASRLPGSGGTIGAMAQGHARWAALIAGFAAWLIVTLPPLASITATPPGRTIAGLGTRTSTVLQSGGDIMILALAAFAVFRMRSRAGTGITGAGDDWLSTLAPVLVLLGVSVLALRLVPLLARLAEWAAERGRSLLGAWGAWQTARRVADQRSVVLLCVLCLGMASVALGAQDTVNRSIEDQSRHTVGAEFRGEIGPGGTPMALSVHQRAANALGEGGLALPVLRRGVTANKSEFTLLALDPTLAPQLVTPRRDQLRDADFGELMARISASENDRGLLLGDVSRITVNARWTADLEEVRGRNRAMLSVALLDADGALHHVSLGEFYPYLASDPDRNAPHDLSVDLTKAAIPLTGRTPFRLHGVHILPGDAYSSAIWLQLNEVRATTRDHGVVTIPATKLPAERTASGRYLSVDPIADEARVIPVLVTPDVARTLGSGLGDEFPLTLGSTWTCEIVGIIDSFPSVDGGVVVADLSAVYAQALGQELQDALYPPQATEVWANRSDPTSVRALTDALGVQADQVSALPQVIDANRNEPRNISLVGTLWLVTLAALALAITSIAATTVVLARERRHDLAVLHGLGVSPRTARRTLVTERLVTLGLATVIGGALGLASSWLIVPSLVTATQAAGATPPVLISIPWPLEALLVLGLGTIFTLVTAFVIGRLPVHQATTTLRMGER